MIRTHTRGKISNRSKFLLRNKHFRLFFSSYGPSGYSNSLPPGIGYPGTDRFGSHSIAASEHDHGHDHESIPNIMEFESKSPPPSSPSSTASTATEKEEIIQRVYKQMRQFTNPIFDG